MSSHQQHLWDEYSLSGTPNNPLDAYTYQQALEYADELDLPDEDWEFIHSCFSLTEKT